ELTAEKLDSPVADHLVGVHVALGAAPRLPDDERKMIVQLPRDHLVRALDDGARHVLGKETELGIDLGAGPLELAEGTDHLAGEALPRDLEVLQGALGLRTPITVGGDVDGAHAVGLASGLHAS